MNAWGNGETDPRDTAAAFGIGKLTRHLFVCLGPDCVDYDEGDETWKYLKKRMKELNIAGRRRPVSSDEVSVPSHLQ